MIFLPQPSSLSYGEGTFTIHYDSRIFLDSESPAELFSAAQLLQQEIETQTGFRPAICRRHQPVGSHLIYLTASPELSREAYTSLSHRKTSRSADLWKAAFSTACRHSVR